MACLFLAVSEDLTSHSCLGCDQCFTVRSTDTLKGSFLARLAEDLYPSPPSGMTYEHLKEMTLAQLTSFTEASHARTSALRDLELAWVESEADFLTTSQGLSKKQTRDLFFSKTSQQLELVASTVSSKHLPSSGMTVGGRFYQPKKLAPVTFAKGGSCLPTPRANDAEKRGDFDTSNPRNGLPAAARLLPTPTAQSYGSNQGGAAGRQGKRRESVESMARRGLIPTPMARDWKASGGANRESPDLSFTMGGYLNPQFVEEIMGYQINHTALEPWATQWFQPKRGKRLCV